MENKWKTITSLVKKYKLETVVLLLILILAAFLRLYKIHEFIIFLGDEGRDALVVKRMIVDHKFTLLGPTASVGGFYLGPIYYYFMIPFLWLANFDPVGPAVMVAIFGTATVGLVYWAVRTWFDATTAAIAALLYATSPGIVSASRTSWNPNIMPFFSLLSVVSLTQAISQKKPAYFILAGIAYGIAIQSHYLVLLLGPILAVATIINCRPKAWIKSAVLELLGFLIGSSMFITFEFRHNFPNTRSIIEFIGRGGNTTGPRSWNFIWLFIEMLRRTYESVLPKIDDLTKVLLYGSLIGFLALILAKRRMKEILPVGVKTILVWIIIGTFGIGAYKGQLYPHYFGFLFPVPFILIASTLGAFSKVTKTKLIAIGVTLVLVVINIKYEKIWGQGSNLIDQTKDVAEAVIKISEKRPFNFALIADGNSDHAYRYFLEILGQKPKALEEEVTEQLIVVCEIPEKPCEPRGHPLWEIAGFGQAEIIQQETVYPGIRILRLVHHKNSLKLIGKPVSKGN